MSPIFNSEQQLALIQRLIPLRRTVVCGGFDTALEILAEHLPLEVVAVASGTECWTWKIPPRWEMVCARVIHESGVEVLNGTEHALAVSPYSQSFVGNVTLDELLTHLRWSEKFPDAFVYEYRYALNFSMSDWCLSLPFQRVKELPKGRYRVEIETTRDEGEIKIGECFLAGNRPETIVIVSHLCHPGQANDGAAGVAGVLRIWAELSQRKNREFSYLFLMPPETIGSVAWLWKRRNLIPKLVGGIVLEMLGVDNKLVVKFSHKRDSDIDRVTRQMIADKDVCALDFRQGYGNDELVFADPDIAVPMVGIQHYPFPEYHTSRDDIRTVVPSRLDEAHQAAMAIVDIIESDYVPQRNFFGPLYLSRFGLYVDTHQDYDLHRKVWEVMQRLGIGQSVLNIAEEVGLPFWKVHNYLAQWEAQGLITRKPTNSFLRTR